jgi:hypothetical protein
MNARLFLAAFVLVGALTLGNVAWGEIDSTQSGILVSDPVKLFQVEETLSLEEEKVPSSSVPEPTTFGLIAMVLAVGGGLMVRRKND